jgi:hypothetical protein
MRTSASKERRVYKPKLKHRTTNVIRLFIREENIKRSGRTGVMVYYKTDARKSWRRLGTVLDCKLKEVTTSIDRE